MVYVLIIGIGVVAGLRSMTAPAAVSWAAYLGWIGLQASPLKFMGSIVAVLVFTIFAIGEYVVDLLPTTPKRTTLVPLTARILMGGLSGATLSSTLGQSLITGAVLGSIGGVIGAFGGYELRKRIVQGLKVKDTYVAIPEDLVAIILAYLIVSM